MGIFIKYRRFFSVHFRVDGTGDFPEYVRFFPLQNCIKTLDSFSLVFRLRTAGFEVFFCQTPLVPIADRSRFSFGFSIPERGFWGKYGLTKENEADPTVYQPGLFFDNLAEDGSVITGSPAPELAVNTTVSEADTFRLYPRTFHVFDVNDSTLPTEYELTSLYDHTLTQTNSVADSASGAYVVTTINSIDMKAHYFDWPGPYLLSSDSETLLDRHVYLDDELGRERVQGVIDIYWETSQNTVADSGQQYHITFKPKSN